jgi:hypothetical protein
MLHCCCKSAPAAVVLLCQYRLMPLPAPPVLLLLLRLLLALIWCFPYCCCCSSCDSLAACFCAPMSPHLLLNQLIDGQQCAQFAVGVGAGGANRGGGGYSRQAATGHMSLSRVLHKKESILLQHMVPSHAGRASPGRGPGVRGRGRLPPLCMWCTVLATPAAAALPACRPPWLLPLSSMLACCCCCCLLGRPHLLMRVAMR